MVYSILGYALTLISALTLWAFVGLLLKLVLFFIVGKILGLPQFLLKAAQYMPPIDFVSSLLHGFLSYWFGGVLLGSLGVPVDAFLGFFLAAAFVIVDAPKIQASKTVPNLQEAKSQLPADLRDNPMFGMFQNMAANEDNPQMQAAKQMMRNNRIIVLIGKVTGALLGLLNLY
jgi:hypothetical protein